MWHQAFGVPRIRDWAPNLAADYIGTIENLNHSQLSDRRTIEWIARQQVDGILTVFSPEPIQHATPGTLGEVGRLILDLLEERVPMPESAPVPDVATALFSLPDDWHDRVSDLKPGHVRLPLGPDQTPRQAFRRYFAGLASSEVAGIGGTELMVSMNEDVNEAPPASSVVAYHPGSFDFQLTGGEEDLASLVLRGEIEIVELNLGEQTRSPGASTLRES